MPKNYYNITHWKAAVEILKKIPQTTANELKCALEVTYVIAQRIKTDYNKICRQTEIDRIIEHRRRIESENKSK